MENHGTEVPGGPSLQSGPADETGVVGVGAGEEKENGEERNFFVKSAFHLQLES